MTPLSPALLQQIKALRESGKTREEVAAELGIKLSTVKTAQSRMGLTIPPEERQANALRKKLEKDPEALTKMRGTAHSGLANAKRSEKMTRFWSSPEERARQSTAISDAWAQKSAEDRTRYRGSDIIAVATELGLLTNVEPDSPLPCDVDLVCSCGRTFSARAYDFLYRKIRSCGCKKSYAEAELSDLFLEMGFSVSRNDRQTIAPLELDIYLPELRLAVEYCGLHYHSEIFAGKKAHLDKLLRCEALGIRLITVFSDEWILRRRVCEAYLKAIVGRFEHKTFARKLILKPLSIPEARAFFETNHLQGAGVESIAWGLFDGSALVSAAGYRWRADRVLEMSRYAVAPGWNVVGGFQRLLKAADSLGARRLVTFSDRRWSTGGVYLRSGFVAEATLPPSYWYTRPGSDRLRWHKSAFRKADLGIEGTPRTEWEEMKSRGYQRIWDCGIVRWVK